MPEHRAEVPKTLRAGPPSLPEPAHLPTCPRGQQPHPACTQLRLRQMEGPMEGGDRGRMKSEGGRKEKAREGNTGRGRLGWHGGFPGDSAPQNHTRLSLPGTRDRSRWAWIARLCIHATCSHSKIISEDDGQNGWTCKHVTRDGKGKGCASKQERPSPRRARHG